MGTYANTSIYHQKGIHSYFLSQKGKKGGHLFNDTADRRFFVTLIELASVKQKSAILSYVLLKNQYAILFQVPPSELSHFIHHINSGYANYYNRHHRHMHAVFGKRFKCFLLGNESSLLEASIYLHLLPNLNKEAKSLLRYEWSSLPGYIEMDKQTDWIDYTRILNLVTRKGDNAPSAYRKELIGRMRSKKKNLWTPQNAAEVNPQQKSHPANTDFDLAVQIKNTVSKEKRFSSLATRNAAIYHIKKFTDLNNGEISRLFAPLKKSSISQMSRRYRNFYETEPSMRKAADRLEIKIKELVHKEAETGISD
jgi:putative transposase